MMVGMNILGERHDNNLVRIQNSKKPFISFTFLYDVMLRQLVYTSKKIPFKYARSDESFEKVQCNG